MKWRWNIAWRMGTGFGVFILAVAILLVVTRMNLSESSALGQEIDEVLVPSLGALEQLDQTLADSRVCINHWLTRQSRAEDEEKVLLRHIVDRKLPQQMAALKAMDGAWTPAASAHVDTLRQEVDRLRVLYGYIMELLPDFRSYDNPAKVMEAERYAVDGGELERFTADVQQRLYTLTEAQNESLRQHTTQMDELGNQLAMVAGRVAWFVLILGIVLGVVVTRSIVQPVKELKRALYHMGRGVLPLETSG